MLYRLAETMETRTAALAAVCSGRREVARAIDRVVWYAGWADKLAQVLGSSNPVAGPYFNFTLPEPTGVVAVIAPDEPALDGLVARVVPGARRRQRRRRRRVRDAIRSRRSSSPRRSRPRTCPAGVVNVLTGLRDELAPVLAAHMDVNAIDVTGADGDVAALEVLAAENVKRVVRAREDRSPWEIARVHGAEDRLAPDRALTRRADSDDPLRAAFLRGTPTHHPLSILSFSLPDLATRSVPDFVPTSCRRSAWRRRSTTPSRSTASTVDRRRALDPLARAAPRRRATALPLARACST